jgi:hypothetical protein
MSFCIVRQGSCHTSCSRTYKVFKSFATGEFGSSFHFDFILSLNWSTNPTSPVDHLLQQIHASTVRGSRLNPKGFVRSPTKQFDVQGGRLITWRGSISFLLRHQVGNCGCVCVVMIRLFVGLIPEILGGTSLSSGRLR